jgi:4-hydroxy-tetrahydrodipicolinate synthase
MNDIKSFQGVISALITPFLPDSQRVDYESFENLVKDQKQKGVQGLVILGTTAETPTLSEEECDKLVALAFKYRSSHFKIYIGTGLNSTKKTLENCFKYLEYKPDGFLIVTPYYNRPSQKGLIEHYSLLLRAFPTIDICLYNVPKRTGVNLDIESFLELSSRYKNLVALKEASGDAKILLKYKEKLKAIHREDVRLLTGDDSLFIESLLCQGDGIISVLSQAFPHYFREVYKEAFEGSFARLKALNEASYSFMETVYSVVNPVGVKRVLAEKNVCSPSVRLPLVEAESEMVLQIREAVKSFSNTIRELGIHD